MRLSFVDRGLQRVNVYKQLALRVQTLIPLVLIETRVDLILRPRAGIEGTTIDGIRWRSSTRFSEGTLRIDGRSGRTSVPL